MGTTTQTEFANTSSWIAFNNLTHVYSGTLNATATAGWITYTLTTPFEYDGSENLVIAFDENTPGYHSPSDEFLGTQMSSNRSIYFYNDVTNPDPVNPPTSGFSLGTSNKIPNIKLEVLPSGCPSPRATVDVIVGAQSANDVGVLSVVNPVDGIFKTANELLSVEVVNYGSSAQSNIPVYYSVDGGTPVSETISTSIPANDTLVYTFSQTADLSIVGHNYSIVSYTALTGDATALNDTVKTTVLHEYPTYCISKANYSSYSEITNVKVGGLLDNYSAPSGALYTDFMNTVAPGFLQKGAPTAVDITTDFAPNNSYNNNGYLKIYIDYNQDGDFDDAGEEVFGGASSAQSSVVGSFIVPVTANEGVTAMRVVHRIYGSATSVSPCGTYTYGETEDYLVNIAPRIPNDAGVEKIIAPGTLVSSGNVSSVVRIRNYGTDTITSVDISYILNNAPAVTMTYNAAPLYPTDSVDVSIGNLQFQSGANSLCAYTTLAGDSLALNDTACMSIYQQANVNLTYFDDFEGSDIWMPDTLLNQWERGVPAMSTITSAHSPVNVWGIDLDGTYANSSDDYLYSPYMVTTGLDSAFLRFWHYYDTESNDGGNIEISLNKGSWVTLGVQNDAKGSNWYNATIGGNPFWSGTATGWVESTYMIDFALFLPAGATSADTIQLRYHFYSSSSGNSKDGWAIDDFSMELPQAAIDGGVVGIISPTDSTTTGSPVNVTIRVKNFGTTALSTIPVVYTVGTTVETATINVSAPGLLPDSTMDYTFANSYTGPTNDYNLCAETNIAGDPYQQNDQYCTSLIASKAPIDVNVYGLSVSPSWGDTTKITYTDTLTMHLENKGTSAITAMVLEYKVGGVVKQSVNWTGNLASGDTLHYTFSQTFTSPINWYQVSAKATLSGDADQNNNEFSHNYYGMNDLGFGENSGDLFSVEQNQPNPAKGKVVVNYNLPKSGKLYFELRNALGQVIKIEEYERTAGKNQIEIDASQLSSGVYYYTLEFDQQRITKKMVVNN